MAFGLSFGAKKTKTNETQTKDLTTTGNQTGVEDTSSTKTGTTTGSQSGTTSSTGQTASTQQSQQSGTTSSSGTTSGSTSSFSDQLKQGIESTIQQLLGGAGGDRDTLAPGISALSNFDAKSFVDNTVASATARQQGALDESLGGLFDSVGGTAETNSMAALLANRLQGDAAANIAGVRGQAEATAQGILQGNLGAQAGALGSATGSTAALINALKGGNVESTQQTVEQQLQELLGNTANLGSTAEQGTTTQQSQQATTETLAQIINQLLNTTQRETGTVNTQGTNSSKGGGLSLGF